MPTEQWPSKINLADVKEKIFADYKHYKIDRQEDLSAIENTLSAREIEEYEQKILNGEKIDPSIAKQIFVYHFLESYRVEGEQN